jgi:hypothetical protein
MQLRLARTKLSIVVNDGDSAAHSIPDFDPAQPSDDSLLVQVKTEKWSNYLSALGMNVPKHVNFDSLIGA